MFFTDFRLLHYNIRSVRCPRHNVVVADDKL